MVRPKLILDTNVCGKLLTPAYSGDLERIKARITRKYQVVVSPQTFIELLDALKGGDGTHFGSDRERIRFMAGGGNPTFLSLPGTFAFLKVLGVKATVTRLSPKDFERWFISVIRAKTRRDLFEGAVRHRLGDRKLHGFSPDELLKQQSEGKTEHKCRLERIRELGNPPIPGSVWASGLATAGGYHLTSKQGDLLVDRLSAADEYDQTLCRIASGGGYNFERHGGDWMDWQQLFYLCDPAIHLLTDDDDIRVRVGNSPQRGQILVLRGFLQAHGFAPQH